MGVYSNTLIKQGLKSSNWKGGRPRHNSCRQTRHRESLRWRERSIYTHTHMCTVNLALREGERERDPAKKPDSRTMERRQGRSSLRMAQ